MYCTHRNAIHSPIMPSFSFEVTWLSFLLQCLHTNSCCCFIAVMALPWHKFQIVSIFQPRNNYLLTAYNVDASRMSMLVYLYGFQFPSEL